MGVAFPEGPELDSERKRASFYRFVRPAHLHFLLVTFLPYTRFLCSCTLLPFAPPPYHLRLFFSSSGPRALTSSSSFFLFFFFSLRSEGASSNVAVPAAAAAAAAAARERGVIPMCTCGNCALNGRVTG